MVLRPADVCCLLRREQDDHLPVVVGIHHDPLRLFLRYPAPDDLLVDLRLALRPQCPESAVDVHRPSHRHAAGPALLQQDPDDVLLRDILTLPDHSPHCAPHFSVCFPAGCSIRPLQHFIPGFACNDTQPNFPREQQPPDHPHQALRNCQLSGFSYPCKVHITRGDRRIGEKPEVPKDTAQMYSFTIALHGVPSTPFIFSGYASRKTSCFVMLCRFTRHSRIMIPRLHRYTFTS